MGVVNILGLPTSIAPTGLVRGNPVGVQLISGRFREDQCLKTAQAIENQLGTFFEELWDKHT